MKFPNKRLFLILLGVIVLQACKTQRVLIKNEYPNPPFRQLLEVHERWQKSIKTFSGVGRITVDTPQFSGNFEAHIYAKGTDSLLVSVSGFMGTEVGKVFVGENRFIFYNQYDNQFITGLKSDFEQTQFLQFPISISMLHDVFLAQDHFTILKQETFKKLPDGYYVEVQNGSYDYRIWFDKTTLLIKKIDYMKDDEIQFTKEYKKFTVFNGFYFPRIINFVRPLEKQGMSIIFKQVTLNEPIDDQVFKIKVSDNAKQLILPADR